MGLDFNTFSIYGNGESYPILKKKGTFCLFNWRLICIIVIHIAGVAVVRATGPSAKEVNLYSISTHSFEHVVYDSYNLYIRPIQDISG